MQQLKPAELRASSHAELRLGKGKEGPPGAQPPPASGVARSAQARPRVRVRGERDSGSLPPAQLPPGPPGARASSEAKARLCGTAADRTPESPASQRHLVATCAHTWPSQGPSPRPPLRPRLSDALTGSHSPDPFVTAASDILGRRVLIREGCYSKALGQVYCKAQTRKVPVVRGMQHPW